MNDHHDGYLYYPPMNCFIHNVCGIVFMKPEHIRQIQEERAKQAKMKEEEEKNKVERQKDIKTSLQKVHEYGEKKVKEAMLKHGKKREEISFEGV